MFQEPQTIQVDGHSLQTDPIRDNDPSHASQEPKGRCRLLIVEDAQCTQRVLCSLLEKMNLDVETAENGQVACEMAEKSKADGDPFDLILMDLQMPVMNGYDATRRLREHRWEGPIVAVTAYTKAEDRQKCLEAGCDDHFSKPITETVLRALIDRYLNGTFVSPWAETAG